jgi:hypothetical protein
MVGKWLQREYYNAVRQGYCPPDQESVVFDEDYADPVKNKHRNLLLRYRSPLLDTIPRDTKWFKVRMAKDDLPSLRLIRYLTWNHLTNGSGRMDIAAKRFINWSERPQNIPSFLDLRTKTELADLIEALKRFRRQADPSTENVTTILVGTLKKTPSRFLKETRLR